MKIYTIDLSGQKLTKKFIWLCLQDSTMCQAYFIGWAHKETQWAWATDIAGIALGSGLSNHQLDG